MRIEAHGGFQNPEKETRPLRFCCTNCGCKFVADPGEYIEGKKNTNAIAYKDPRPRTKIYVSVCPECNEVVLIPESCAHFVGKHLTSLDIFGLTGSKVRVISKKPNTPSGIYKIVECSIESSKDCAAYGFEIEATLSLLQDDSYHGGPILIHYNSNDSEGVEIYAFDEE